MDQHIELALRICRLPTTDKKTSKSIFNLHINTLMQFKTILFKSPTIYSAQFLLQSRCSLKINPFCICKFNVSYLGILELWWSKSILFEEKRKCQLLRIHIRQGKGSEIRQTQRQLFYDLLVVWLEEYYLMYFKCLVSSSVNWSYKEHIGLVYGLK